MQMFLVFFLLCLHWCCANGDDFHKTMKKRFVVAQCRASCLQNFIKSAADEKDQMGCTSNWKCNMCWDYCESLAIFERTRIQMCTDDICLEGCKGACKFFEQGVSLSATNSIAFQEPKIYKNQLITWSFKSERAGPHVFIVLGLKFDNRWEEIYQTAERYFILPRDGPKLAQIALVALDPQGISAEVHKKLVFNLPRSRRSTGGYLEQIVEQRTLTAAIACTAFAAVSILSIIFSIIFYYLRKCKNNNAIIV